MGVGCRHKKLTFAISSPDEFLVVIVWCFLFILDVRNKTELECGPMPNAMAALPNIDGALCSTPQNLADAHYSSAVQ